MWPNTFNKKCATISGWQCLGDFAAVKQQLQKIRASTRIPPRKGDECRGGGGAQRPLPPLPPNNNKERQLLYIYSYIILSMQKPLLDISFLRKFRIFFSENFATFSSPELGYNLLWVFCRSLWIPRMYVENNLFLKSKLIVSVCQSVRFNLPEGGLGQLTGSEGSDQGYESDQSRVSYDLHVQYCTILMPKDFYLCFNYLLH